MKIAVLGIRGFPDIQGGVEKHCENLYPRLVKKGCEVIVFTRKPYIKSPQDNHDYVKLISLPCPRNKYFEAFFHTLLGVFVAKRVHPDILHIHAVGPSLVIPFARILGLKVVVTNHGPDYKRAKWPRPAKLILRFGEMLGSKCANALICISKPIADEINKKYNRETTVIPNGISIPEALSSEEILKKYGLEKGKYILTVGRFVPEKGFYDLIGAFQNFKGQSPKSGDSPLNSDWKLVIVGAADHEDKYSANLKEKAGENSSVILTGLITGEPLQELYSHAGFFVLPSYYEGLPIALLEAMSYGLLCIASDIPANRCVRLREENYFPAGDIGKLTEKIGEFISKPLPEEERLRQIEMLRKDYDWDAIANKTLEVYKKILC